jgi:hypothetical protein
MTENWLKPNAAKIGMLFEQHKSVDRAPGILVIGRGSGAFPPAQMGGLLQPPSRRLASQIPAEKGWT